MKVRNIALFTVAISSLSLFSCKGKLEKNIEGTWNGSPQSIELADPIQAGNINIYSIDVQNSYDFDQVTNNSGNVDITSLVSIGVEIPQTPGDSFTENDPWAETLNGIASLKGTYTVDSDDKISLSYNESSFNLQIDQKGKLNVFDDLVNTNTVEGTSYSDSLRLTVKNAIQEQVMNKLTSLKRLEDIKMTDWQLDGKSGPNTIKLSKVFTNN